MLVLVFGVAVPSANAADLLLGPAATTAGINQTFDVHVHIDSGGTSINAAQGTIVYPDNLSVVSIDTTDSVFNFWLQEPTVSASAHRISFIGGTPSGVSGSALQVFTVTFKGTAIGAGDISFVDGAVTASDGTGANIVGNMAGVHFSIASTTSTPAGTTTSSAQQQAAIPTPVPVVRTPAPASGLPSAPDVSAPLYPNPTEWYDSVAQYTASWPLPADVTGVSAVVNGDPTAAAPTKSEGLFTSKTFPAVIEDGIQYLHVRFQNALGWGPTAHYRIAVDTQPPLPFNLTVVSGLSSNNPSPELSFSATDARSGIAHYRVTVAGEEPVTLGPNGQEGTVASVSEPQQRAVEIVGSATVNTREGPSTSYPLVTKVALGDTYPYTEVQDGWYHITLTDGTTAWVIGTYTQETSSVAATPTAGGAASYTLPPHEPGTYAITVQAIDAAGNSVESRVQVEILPIDMPNVAFMTTQLVSGSDTAFAVRGTALPNSDILISLEGGNGTVVIQDVVRSDAQGAWSYQLTRDLRSGTYAATFQTRDSRGALSLPTSPRTLKVTDKPIVVLAGISFTARDIIALLVIAIILTAIYFLRKISIHELRIKMNAIIANRDLTNALDQVRKEIPPLADAVSKKKVSMAAAAKARGAIKRIQEILTRTEKYVGEDIQSMS